MHLHLARVISLFVLASLTLGCGAGMVSGDTGDDDAALGQSCAAPLTISAATASSFQSGHPARDVLDGALGTRWAANGKGQFITAQLASTSTVCGVRVAWYAGSQRKSHFVLSVSADGKSFSNVFTGSSSGSTEKLETYSLSTVRSARFVRVTVEGNSQNEWASLSELGILGSTTSRVKPGPGNTGVPAGTQLHRLEGNQLIDASWLRAHPTGLPANSGPGVIEDQDIYGSVHITVPGVTLRRSRIHGEQTPPAPSKFAPVVWVTVGDATADLHTKVLIEDCDVRPSHPSAEQDGIFGYNFTARRNDVSHSTDGFGVMFFTDIESNWCHDLTYWNNSTEHTNGTHNDCAQLHDLKQVAGVISGPVRGWGGRNRIVGNFFSAFIAQDTGTPASQAKLQPGALGHGWDHQAMSDIMINSNFENTVTDNWFEGGYLPINGVDVENLRANLGTYERNVFDKMRYDNPGKYFAQSGLGSFDQTPRLTLGFAKGTVVTTGSDSADLNRFESPSTTPGVVGGAPVHVLFE